MQLEVDALDGSAPVSAVLFDRDGTLVVDVPYNGNPDEVVLMPRVLEATSLLHRAGIAMGVVSNQSGVGRGLLNLEAVAAVHSRLSELLPSLQVFLYCPHAPEDRCLCRKPQPQLVIEAARQLRAPVGKVAVIGDRGSDVAAARAAGARGILVPAEHTSAADLEEAEEVASDIYEAARKVLESS